MTYVSHVLKNIGTIYHTEKIVPESGAEDVMAPYAVHKAAVKFVIDQVFKTPMWLNNEEVLTKLPMISFGIELNNIQREAIDVLIVRNRLSRLLWAEYGNTSGSKVYTVGEFLDDLNKGIFTELYEGRNVDAYRRNLQKAYVARLIRQAFDKPDVDALLPYLTFHIYQTDIPGLLKDALRQEQVLFKKALANPGLDKMTRLHLRELNTLIDGQWAAERNGK
jgi:hypothetical protein